MKYPKGHEFEFKYLRPSQIVADPLYQRPLDQRRVEQIVKEFSGDLFNEPKVSYRDGKYWVFNGQHSLAAWRHFYGNEDKPVFCKVFKGMTWLEECDAFMKQNGLSKDPTTNEKLHAAFNSKDPDVVDMVEKAKLCGFDVNFSQSKTPTRIIALSALFRAYKMLGSEAFLDMLTAIKEAWYGDIDAVSQQIISGMASFYKAYGGNFKREALVNALKKTTPARIIAQGKSFTNRTNTYTREIVKAYNMKRKYRLDENKL